MVNVGCMAIEVIGCVLGISILGLVGKSFVALRPVPPHDVLVVVLDNSVDVPDDSKPVMVTAEEE